MHISPSLSLYVYTYIYIYVYIYIVHKYISYHTNIHIPTAHGIHVPRGFPFFLHSHCVVARRSIGPRRPIEIAAYTAGADLREVVVASATSGFVSWGYNGDTMGKCTIMLFKHEISLSNYCPTIVCSVTAECRIYMDLSYLSNLSPP